MSENMQGKLEAAVAAIGEESLLQTFWRFKRGLEAIADETRSPNSDFAEWARETARMLLEGFEAECPECGTHVHEGACVGDDEPFE